MPTIDDRFLLRGGLKAALTSLNEVPLRREMIIELDNLWTTGKFEAKIGDGTTHYNALPYLATGGGIESIIEGYGISIDVTDQKNPVLSSTLGSIALSGRYDEYDDLPGGLGPSDAGKAYFIAEDQLIYIWDGTAFPASGDGVSLGQDIVYDPRKLFKSGDTGAFFDGSDLGTLFTDVAGTVPAVNNGDRIALWKDKSGNGNDASQATLALRPSLYISGGVIGVAFNGSQYMDCGAAFHVATVGSLFTVYNCASSNQRVIDCRGTGTLGTAGIPGIQFKPYGTGGGDGFTIADSSANFAGVNFQSILNADTNFCGTFKTGATMQAIGDTDHHFLRPVSTAAVGSVASSTVSRIGAASNDATQGLVGRVYAIVFNSSRVFDKEEINSLRNFARKITLYFI